MKKKTIILWDGAAFLPSLRTTDAIAQYLGVLRYPIVEPFDLQPGDIVRIDRLDQTIYYRRVVLEPGASDVCIGVCV